MSTEPTKPVRMIEDYALIGSTEERGPRPS